MRILTIFLIGLVSCSETDSHLDAASLTLSCSSGMGNPFRSPDGLALGSFTGCLDEGVKASELWAKVQGEKTYQQSVMRRLQFLGQPIIIKNDADHCLTGITEGSWDQSLWSFQPCSSETPKKSNNAFYTFDMIDVEYRVQPKSGNNSPVLSKNKAFRLTLRNTVQEMYKKEFNECTGAPKPIFPPSDTPEYRKKVEENWRQYLEKCPFHAVEAVETCTGVKENFSEHKSRYFQRCLSIDSRGKSLQAVPCDEANYWLPLQSTKASSDLNYSYTTLVALDKDFSQTLSSYNVPEGLIEIQNSTSQQVCDLKAAKESCESTVSNTNPELVGRWLGGKCTCPIDIGYWNPHDYQCQTPPETDADSCGHEQTWNPYSRICEDNIKVHNLGTLLTASCQSIDNEYTGQTYLHYINGDGRILGGLQSLDAEEGCGLDDSQTIPAHKSFLFECTDRHIDQDPICPYKSALSADKTEDDKESEDASIHSIAEGSRPIESFNDKVEQMSRGVGLVGRVYLAQNQTGAGFREELSECLVLDGKNVTIQGGSLADGQVDKCIDNHQVENHDYQVAPPEGLFRMKMGSQDEVYDMFGIENQSVTPVKFGLVYQFDKCINFETMQIEDCDQVDYIRYDLNSSLADSKFLFLPCKAVTGRATKSVFDCDPDQDIPSPQEIRRERRRMITEMVFGILGMMSIAVFVLPLGIPSMTAIALSMTLTAPGLYFSLNDCINGTGAEKKSGCTWAAVDIVTELAGAAGDLASTVRASKVDAAGFSFSGKLSQSKLAPDGSAFSKLARSDLEYIGRVLKRRGAYHPIIGMKKIFKPLAKTIVNLPEGQDPYLWMNYTFDKVLSTRVRDFDMRKISPDIPVEPKVREIYFWDLTDYVIKSEDFTMQEKGRFYDSIQKLNQDGEGLPWPDPRLGPSSE